MQLLYYCHRYGGFTANIMRAKRNFAVHRDEFARKGIVVWAPWIALAEAMVLEAQVWPAIEACIDASSGIIWDLDGESPSPGLMRERGIADRMGKGVIEIR